MEEEIECEVNDFYFRQLCKVRISPGLTFLNDRVNHIAVSNQYGLIFAVAVNDIKVIYINEIEKLSLENISVVPVVTNFNHQIIKIGLSIQQICLSCDESTLIVVYRDGKMLNMGVVDIKILNEQTQSEAIFASTCISQSPDVYVKDMRVHPDTPALTAICLSNGHVLILELSDNVLKTVSMLTKTENACSISWSPKGKRIAVGQKDGKLVQYDKSLKEEKKITECHLFGEETKSVNGLYWLSSFQFFVVYASVDGKDSSTAAVVTAPNNDPPLFHSLEDIYFGFNKDRLLYYYFAYLSEWQLMITMSSNNMEAVPVGNVEKKWSRWILQDFGRAEVPLSDKSEDAFAVGVGISLNSKLTIQQDEKELPASPVFFMLSTDGVLCAYQMVNTFLGTNHKIVNPPKPIPQGDAKRGNVSKIASKSPHIDFWSQQTSSSSVNNFNSVTTLSSPFNKNANFSVPPSTAINLNKKIIDDNKSISFDFGGKSSSSEPNIFSKSTFSLGQNTVAPTTGSFLHSDKLSVEPRSSNDASRKVSGKKQSNVSFNIAASFPDQSNTVASIATPAFSFSSQNKSILSENFPLVPSTALTHLTSQIETTPSTPLFQNKQLKSFQFTPNTFDNKPLTEQIETSKSVISSNTKLAYNDMEIKIYSDKLETALQKNISEELKSFNNEMDMFLQSVSDSQQDLIGTQLELQQIRKSVEDVERLVNKYKLCMAENKKESCELRNILLLNFKNADEAKLQKEKMEDKRFSIILKSRPLDPVSSRQKKLIHDQMNGITERLIDVNIALDEEWKKIEMRKKNVINKNSSILQNQQVYKTVDAIDQIASNLSNRLKTLKMKSESNDILLMSKNLTLYEDSSNKTKYSCNSNNNITSQPKNISHLRNYLSRRSKTPLHKSKPSNTLLHCTTMPDDLSNTVYIPLNGNVHPKAASTPFFTVDNSKQIGSSVSVVLEEKHENKFNSPQTCITYPDDQKNKSTLIVTKKLFVESPVAKETTLVESPVAKETTLEKHDNQTSQSNLNLVQNKNVFVQNELPLKSFDSGKSFVSSSKTFIENVATSNTSADHISKVSSLPSHYAKENSAQFSNLFEKTTLKTPFNTLHSTSCNEASSGLFAVSMPSGKSMSSLLTAKELSSSKTSFSVNANVNSTALFSNELVNSSVEVFPSVKLPFPAVTTISSGSISTTNASTSVLGGVFNITTSTAMQPHQQQISTGFSGFGLHTKITTASTSSSPVVSEALLSASAPNLSCNNNISFSSNVPSTGGLFSFAVTTGSSASSVVSNSDITNASGLLSANAISTGTLSSFFVSNPKSTSGLLESAKSTSGLLESNIPLFNFNSSAGNSLFNSNVPSVSGGLFGSNVLSTDSSILSNSNAKTVSSGNSNAKTTGLFGSTITPTVVLSSASIAISNAATTVLPGSLFSFNTTTTLAGGLFGSNVPSALVTTAITSVSSGNLFNSVKTTQSQLFGTTIPSTVGLTGATAVTTVSSGSLFSSNTATPVAGGLFGTNVTSTIGLFSGTAVTSVSSSSFFNAATTSTSGLFGSIASSTNSLFSSSTGTGFSTGLFGFNTATTCSSGGLFSSTSSNGTIGGIFGSNATVNSSGNLFNSSNSAGPSGGLFSSQSKGNFFGSTTSTSGTNATSVSGGLFGSSNQSTGFFNTPTSDSKGFFNAPSVQNNLFGSKTTESLDSSMSNKAGDVGAFGGLGLGGKPMSDPNKNPFAVVSSTSVQSSNIFGSASGFSGSNFGNSSGANIFGNSSGANIFGNTSGSSGASLFGQSSNQATGSFSKGFGTGFTQVQPSAFGSPPASAPIFGASPSFGGNPVFGSPQQGTNTFGGAPTFGSGATFGGVPSFGSGAGVFGGGSVNVPTFGNLASNTGAPSFGSLGSPQPFGQSGNVFGSTPIQTTSQQFSSWR